MSKQSEPVGLTPVLVDDLIEDLVWPKLLRAGGLALAPQRLGLAFFTVIALMLLVSAANQLSQAGDAETGGETSFLDTFWSESGLVFQALGTWDARATAAAMYHWLVGLPIALLAEHPWATILLVPLLLLVTVIGGGAVARSAAVDYGLGETRPWPRVLGFSVGRWLSLLGAGMGPLLLVWGIVLMLAIGGWLFFNLAVLNIIGGLLYGLFLIGALVGAVIIIAYVLGWIMLIPAVMVEGTDGFDAVSRVYEFVFNRPVRLVLYLLVVFVQGVVAVFVAAILAGLVLLVARAATGAWVGPLGEAVLTPQSGSLGDEAGWTWRAADWLVELWIAIPVALVLAYAFSYIHCAGTMMYLALRRVNDGQDMREVWVPGMVEGTMAQALAAKTAESPKD